MSVRPQSWARFAVSRLRIRTLVALSGAAVLAACGGGGGGDGDGGTLYVSLSYSGSAQLFRQSTISPNISGLNGHKADCSLSGGRLPAGMNMQANCSITGTPVEAGTFPITVRLKADGVSNSLEWSASVLVQGPSVIYSIPWNMMAGTSYDLAPLNTIFWTPTAADTVVYSVVEGALPAGLTVDPATGHIAGTPTAAGSYNFKIGAQVTNAGRVASVVEPYQEQATVGQPTISYNQWHGYAGMAFTSTPFLYGATPTYTFSAATLPSGLTIDPATGTISGTPNAVASGTYRINVSTPTAGGGTYTFFTDVSLTMDSPVAISWSNLFGTRTVAFDSVPNVQNISGTSPTVIAYSYAVDPASVLPTGLLMDGTGHITGTPTSAGVVTTRINVTVTFNTTTFVVPVDVTFTIS